MRHSLVFAFLLVASPLAAQATLLEVSGSSSGGFGSVVDLIGDANGDGVCDLLISSPYDSTGTPFEAGSASVYSGADASVLYTVRGTDGRAHMGRGASAVGDVNADGYADFVVAAPDDDLPRMRDGGRVLVFSGRDGSLLREHLATRLAESFGWSCAEIGDVDEDGHADVMASAPGAVTPGGQWVGAVRIFSGADGHLLVRAYGDHVARLLGSYPIHGLGDIDGDGKPDFIARQVELVRVFSGADGHEIRRHAYPTDSFLVLSGGLDANGDGFNDYLIGHAAFDDSHGRVQVFSGVDGTLLRELVGERSVLALGSSVLGLGDLDGDGYGDLATGVPYANTLPLQQSGEVRAYNGHTGAEIARVSGSRAGDRLGAVDLGGGRDFSGDGLPDLVVATIGRPLVQVLSLVPRGLEPFGTGTPGCAGELSLLANASPTVGSTGFTMHLSGVGEDVTSLLMSDVPDLAGTTRYNALFHVNGARILSRTLLPAADPHRSLAVGFPIPADPLLHGLTYYFQGVSFFPSGACSRRISTTRGLRLTFQ